MQAEQEDNKHKEQESAGEPLTTAEMIYSKSTFSLNSNNATAFNVFRRHLHYTDDYIACTASKRQEEEEVCQTSLIGMQQIIGTNLNIFQEIL